ncbi:MAG TPA: MarR family transcriptional regulator [Burkholderiales bacterium]
MKTGAQPTRRASRRRSPDGAPALARGLLPELLGYHLRLAQIAIFKDFKQSVGKDGITPGLFGVLVLIEANAGMKQTELARAVHLDRSTVVNVIDNLERMKLVERRAVEGDRRSRALYLTPQGKARLQKLKREVLEHERRLARHLSPAEREQLVDLLGRIFPEHR